jgi:hypothetical protein
MHATTLNYKILFSEKDRYNVWRLGYSSINLAALNESLNNDPKKDIAGKLFEGFSSGIKINYHGPRLPLETNKLKSVLENVHFNTAQYLT